MNGILVIQGFDEHRLIKERRKAFGRDQREDRDHAAHDEQSLQRPHRETEQVVQRTDEGYLFDDRRQHAFEQSEQKFDDEKEREPRDKTDGKPTDRFADDHCHGRAGGDFGIADVLHDDIDQELRQFSRQRGFKPLRGNIDVEPRYFGKPARARVFDDGLQSEDTVRPVDEGFHKQERDENGDEGRDQPEKAGDEPAFRGGDGEHEKNDDGEYIHRVNGPSRA